MVSKHISFAAAPNGVDLKNKPKKISARIRESKISTITINQFIDSSKEDFIL